jgi:hypothetical protein
VQWSDIAPWLTAPGAGLLAYVFLRLHNSAISAYRDVASQWRQLALEREKQLMHVMNAVQDVKDKVP